MMIEVYLAAALGFSSIPTDAPPPPLPPPSPIPEKTVAYDGEPPAADENATVLILGAGLAGVTAAAKLHEAGVDFLLIEGQAQIGGRVRGAEFAGKKIELGANWVHAAGKRNGSCDANFNNPIWDLVLKTGLTYDKSNYDDSVVMFDAASGPGTPVEDKDIRWGFFEYAVQCMNQEQLHRWCAAQNSEQCPAEHPSDISLRVALRKCGWEPNTPADFAIEWYEYDYEWAHAPEITGTTASYAWTYNVWKEEDYFITDQSRGFIAVVEEVGKSFLPSAPAEPVGVAPPPPSPLRLNSRVIGIEWAVGGGVRVSVFDTANGAVKTYSGKYAICTFSTGVLQHSLEAAVLTNWSTLARPRIQEAYESYSYSYAPDPNGPLMPTGEENQVKEKINETLTFAPPLPAWKSDVLAAMPMAYYTKIWMKFEEQFWRINTECGDHRPCDKEFHIWADEWRGYFPVWQNFNVLKDFEDQNILMVTLSGRDAYSAEGMSDDTIIRRAMGVLRQMYTNASEPVEIHVSRWSRDPFFYGAYSDRTTGTFAYTGNILEYPINQLFFSGEATSPHAYGFLHGALYAGNRTTSKLLACMGRTEKVPHLFPSVDYTCPLLKYNLTNVLETYERTDLWRLHNEFDDDESCGDEDNTCGFLAGGTGTGRAARRERRASRNQGVGNGLRHHTKKFRHLYDT